jgi:dipeptidyl-peptidase-3
MKNTILMLGLSTAVTMVAYGNDGLTDSKPDKSADPFEYNLEQFADLGILRYQVPGFENLSLSQKSLIYYLSQASLAGRDIIWDQNGKYNLLIRHTLENIYKTYRGDKTSAEYAQFVIYLKRVWFSNGIYHHYASDKIQPGFSAKYFKKLMNESYALGFPLKEGMTISQLTDLLTPVICDPKVMPKKVCKDHGVDIIKSSSVNFYDGVSQAEAEAFYDKMRDPKDLEPISYGLNSKLVKKDGKIVEMVYKSDGLYSEAIGKIIYWLRLASTEAENPAQKAYIESLIKYYTTGDLKEWDRYNILWVQDLASHIDFINGFIESYEDPLGSKATWEAMVNFKDTVATRRTETISTNAQWFENHSPIDPRFRKEKVKGVSAKVIIAAQLGGEAYPSTAIGINLPNANWIRKEYGSKSVTIANITHAYDQASLGNGFLEEFAYDANEIALARKYGSLTNDLHTDLHECLGHGSGQLLPGVSPDALKNYSSTLEEARADLFGLYYMMDAKMVELGILPDTLAAEAEYASFMRNGLMTQLVRIEPGKNIEEDHMRNRQLIAQWCYEKGLQDNVVEFVVRNGKTYVRINDYSKLRQLFASLLAEIQRIKSEGDFEAGKQLVEKYGVKVDPKLHKEVLDRYKKLNLAPYKGFVNPEYEVVKQDGKIIDVKIKYVDDFSTQMLNYSEKYSFLPVWN